MERGFPLRGMEEKNPLEGEKEENVKKAFCLLFVLVFAAAFVSAQEFGAIRGKVVDQDGEALPGERSPP